MKSKPSNTAPVVSVVIIPRLLNIPNAARYLSASVFFTEQLLASGEVISFIQGRERVVDVRELDRYVDRRNAERPLRLVKRAENLRVAA
jgi:hypothetical protein